MNTNTPHPAKALSDAEAQLAANADELRREAPEQFDALQRIIATLKKAPGKAVPEEVKKLALGVLQWELSAAAQDYQAQKEQLEKLGVNDPAVAASAQALGQLTLLLENAKQMKDLPALTAQLEQVRAAFDAADAAVDHSTVGIAMHKVKTPIVSASGVALAPVMPAPRAAAGASAPRAAGPVIMAAPPPPRPSGPVRDLGSSGPVRRPGEAPPPPTKKKK